MTVVYLKLPLKPLPSVDSVPLPADLLEPLSASRRAMTIQTAISSRGARRGGQRTPRWPASRGGAKAKYE